MTKKTKKQNDAAAVDAVAIAEKQRLRLLLTKVNDDKALTKAELDEFKHLESKFMSPSNGPTREKVAFAKKGVLQTQGEAADYAGVSVMTINRWVKSGMMRTERKFYIKSQLDIFKQNKGKGQSPNEHNVRAIKATADVKEAQAALLKLELDSRQDTYHSAEKCLQKDVVRIYTLKRGMMGMGRKVAQQFPKRLRRRIQAACNREVRTICNNFAEGRV